MVTIGQQEAQLFAERLADDDRQVRMSLSAFSVKRSFTVYAF